MSLVTPFLRHYLIAALCLSEGYFRTEAARLLVVLDSTTRGKSLRNPEIWFNLLFYSFTMVKESSIKEFFSGRDLLPPNKFHWQRHWFSTRVATTLLNIFLFLLPYFKCLDLLAIQLPGRLPVAGDTSRLEVTMTLNQVLMLLLRKNSKDNVILKIMSFISQIT